MSSEGSTVDLLNSHQSPNMVSIMPDEDDIEWIVGAYRILTEVVLKIPSLFDKITLTQENRVALYEEALKVGLTLDARCCDWTVIVVSAMSNLTNSKHLIDDSWILLLSFTPRDGPSS